LGWCFVVVRVVGRSLVVPPLEEVFYRSFFYRYIASAKFMELPLGVWHTTAFFVTSTVFGLAHPGQWVQGILCGAAFQGLVVRKRRLGDAMLAHATTNLLISGYAIATGQWQFT
jgi:CAAX prenyl protease-like protein